MVELRWAVPEGTTTEPPRLQYRQCGAWPATWGEWADVPREVDAACGVVEASQHTNGDHTPLNEVDL